MNEKFNSSITSTKNKIDTVDKTDKSKENSEAVVASKNIIVNQNN